MRVVRSLGYRTDLALAAEGGIVEDRGPYIVIRTPSNPTFHWGNYLLFPEPPDARASECGHAGSWLDAMDRELPGQVTPLFGWDRPDGATGDIDGFLRLGFQNDTSAILTATRVERSPKHNDEVRVEALRDDRDWQDAARALVAAFAPRRSGTLADLADFVDRQLTRYRAMQARGSGQWFGARLDGEIAATLGLVFQESIGRFQLVGTDPRFARRGVCSSLVHHVARWGLDERGLATLVMAADAEYHAAHVYESVGFVRRERLHALLRRPPRA